MQSGAQQVTRVDERYYEVAGPGSVAERLLVGARNRIYADFVRLMAPDPADSILDVGVSDVVGAGANLLERLYPQRHRITAAGLGEGADFRAAFPDVAYVRITPGGPLPFRDREFSIACANAVLEHVGGERAQRALLAEMMRVARRVFVTVPNRYFPVEHHTALPLAAWSDWLFRLACRVTGKISWTRPENLTLMSRTRLAELRPAGVSGQVGMTGLRLGPLSSNLYLSFTSGPDMASPSVQPAAPTSARGVLAAD